jgi:hypothetical protein
MTNDKFKLLCSNTVESFETKLTTKNYKTISLLLKYGLCKTIKKNDTNGVHIVIKPLSFELKTFNSFASKTNSLFDALMGNKTNSTKFVSIRKNAMKYLILYR